MLVVATTKLAEAIILDAVFSLDRHWWLWQPRCHTPLWGNRSWHSYAMKRDLIEKLSDTSHSNLIRWMAWTIAGAALTLVCALGLYMVVFSGGLSSEREAWGQFGDFVGGTINPILGFLTVVALALTLILQNRQLAVSAEELALSRTELRLTREELARSVSAQEASERALRAQAASAEQSAKLSAMNFLLGHYSSEIHKMHGQAYIQGSPRIAQLEELQRRKATLETMLDELYAEITSDRFRNERQ